MSPYWCEDPSAAAAAAAAAATAAFAASTENRFNIHYYKLPLFLH